MFRSLLLLSLVTLSLAQFEIRGSVYPCPLFGLGRLQHRNQCGRYVQCVNGDAVERSCATGLHFNAATGECSSPETASCRVEDGICPLYTDPRELVYLFDGERCDKYYLCFGGRPQEFDCGTGYYWVPERSHCEPANEVMCWIYNVDCPEDGNGRIPHPSDCQKYFHCENGRRFGGRCRNGEIFDINTNLCLRENEATCINPPTTTSPVTPSVDTTTYNPPTTTIGIEPHDF